MTHFARFIPFTFAGIAILAALISLNLTPPPMTFAAPVRDSTTSGQTDANGQNEAAKDVNGETDSDSAVDAELDTNTDVEAESESGTDSETEVDTDDSLDQVAPFMDPRGDVMRSRRALASQPMTDQDVREVIAVLEDINPTLAQRLHAALRNNPERARNMVSTARDRIRLLIEARRNDPRLYELRVRDFRLTQRTNMVARHVKQIRNQGNRRAIAQASARLRNLLIEHFEVRQALREHELKRLEARLVEMRHQLEAQSREKEKLIDRRLREMLTDDAPAGR